MCGRPSRPCETTRGSRGGRRRLSICISTRPRRPRAGQLIERRAWVSQRRGDVPGALRLLRRGVRLLEATTQSRLSMPSSPLRTRGRHPPAARAEQGCMRAHSGRHRRGDCLRRSDDLPQLPHLGLVLTRARPARRGSAHEALEIFAALGELRERAGALNNLGAVAYWTGDWDTATDLYGQAADMPASAAASPTRHVRSEHRRGVRESRAARRGRTPPPILVAAISGCGLGEPQGV